MSKLREKRKALGLTLFDVALGSKVREPYISAIETRKTIAYPGQRRALAGFYGVEEKELFDEKGFAREAE